MRRWIFQLVVTVSFVSLLSLLGFIAAGNLARQGIATGYGFLFGEARFEISESIIAYSAADSYGRALVVGFLNTLKVSLLAIVLATAIGTAVGIARLSSNKLLAGVAGAYVEALRNIPLLLQLSFWYGLLTITLPVPRAALNPIEGVFLSNRGVVLPTLEPHAAYGRVVIALMLGLAAVFLLNWLAACRQEKTGRRPRIAPAALLLLVGPALAAWYFSGAPTALDMPRLQGFNFIGGMRLSPEFSALLFGLTAYSATFIAETVRGGIQAVSSGQSEAGGSLGLRPGLIMRLIILPQALRTIIPPMTSQYLNMTKNSSLGVAIAYPDLVAIGNITMNQTGQAIEVVSIFMIVYLTMSLAISGFMNWYNHRMALVMR
ncbi:amino acid ABC transporter permease [Rhizobium leguminosarum]|uniref:amino acid ABC transporter permease n=1 Tax=Rhizobium leguminosarum TaxID=384 RepID=UPI001C97C1A6|nr:ABC transporter permease subunit [Rhizobium leguminosarum]